MIYLFQYLNNKKMHTKALGTLTVNIAISPLHREKHSINQTGIQTSSFLQNMLLFSFLA